MDSPELELQEYLEQLDPKQRVTFAEAVLGKNALEFFESDVGRYMVGCAKQEYAEAAEKLARTFPWRSRRIAQLQNQMWRAESFVTWLRDLILRGKQAERMLDEGDDNA